MKPQVGRILSGLIPSIIYLILVILLQPINFKSGKIGIILIETTIYYFLFPIFAFAWGYYINYKIRVTLIASIVKAFGVKNK